jgi:hypothetical protein
MDVTGVIGKINIMPSTQPVKFLVDCVQSSYLVLSFDVSLPVYILVMQACKWSFFKSINE